MSNDSQMIDAGTLVLERFEIRERVARGGFAVVWKAHDRLLGKDVALKVLHSAIADDPAAIEEMKRETLRSRELTHPHIVQTYDFVQDGTIVAIAMEFIDGQTMATLAAERPNGCFNPADIAVWMGDICDALGYAHSEIGGKKAVVHHDLKPSNFIVDRYGTAKVLDFGISKGTAETRFQHTGEFTVAGTPPYMSPQQLRGQRPSPSDDIYSFGATVYALLTRKPPFFRGDIPTQVLNETPPTMNQRRVELGVDEPPIAMEWEETIACCLAKEPELRPTSMSEVAVSLGIREPSTRRRAMTGTATTKKSGTGTGGPAGDKSTQRSVRAEPPTKSRKAKSPRRGKKAAVGALAASGVVGAAILLGRRGETMTPVVPVESPVDAAPPTLRADAGLGAGLMQVSDPANTATSPQVTPEREWAEREAELLRRQQALRGTVQIAMTAESWEAASAPLAELEQIAPDDPDVAAWKMTVEDQLAVRDLVESYRLAQESRDADAYGMLWESLGNEEVAAIRASYAGIRSLTLTIDELQARVEKDRATVRLRERIAFDLRGVGKQTTDARTVLSLKKTPAGWRIAARETES